MFSPLAGVRVVDLTHVFAGPYCTQLLAFLGAEVIKVEPPVFGDLTRWAGEVGPLNQAGVGLSFCTQNTDKRSIAVDLHDEEGVAVVRRLVTEADVFVENFRPGVVERLGLGRTALLEVNPDLVYVSITAYGQDGPIGHRPAYDHVVQAMSGIMQTTGTDETGPIKVGAPFVDYATGQKAAFATVAAVMEQRRTGEPQYVDVSMLDTALLLMANTLTTAVNTGERPAKLGNDAAGGAPSSGCFATADDLLALAANNERQFRDLCEALDHPEWANDPRFAKRRDRVAHAEEFSALLSETFATGSANHWEQVLDEAGVPASRVRALDETLSEGQPEARGLTTPMTVDDTQVHLAAAGFKANGEVPGPSVAPRTLGADTVDILAELGYSDDEIAHLRSSGVV